MLQMITVCKISYVTLDPVNIFVYQCVFTTSNRYVSNDDCLILFSTTSSSLCKVLNTVPLLQVTNTIIILYIVPSNSENVFEPPPSGPGYPAQGWGGGPRR